MKISHNHQRFNLEISHMFSFGCMHPAPSTIDRSWSIRLRRRREVSSFKNFITSRNAPPWLTSSRLACLHVDQDWSQHLGRRDDVFLVTASYHSINMHPYFFVFVLPFLLLLASTLVDSISVLYLYLVSGFLFNKFVI